ncbi:MAG: phosphate acyltransferase PlsX [Solirubrobacterales bacterium]
MTIIALDGRGAERGPEAIIAGARAAAGDGIGIRVFGDPDSLAPLDGVGGVEIVAAAQEITNHDEPVSAVRSRPEASVVMAARDVAEGGSDALASAGSTGATMTAALFALRRTRGVRRPALAVQLVVPGGSGPPTLLLDVGANAEARAVDLVQFAYLGAAFSKAVLGVADPRVALLSVGEESKKGSREVIEAHERLAAAGGGGGESGSGPGIDFRGNLEGRDLLAQSADVIVTDGFTGNVVLKTIEGTAGAVAGAVRDAARSGVRAAAGGVLLRPALGGLRRQMDPDATGGAILLGLRAVAVVGHGSSGPDGIANAVRLAARAVDQRAVERTVGLLDDSGMGRGAMRDRKGE